MEGVIARLLSDFETGKLTRRQLVQTLGLMAVGSPVASAIAQSVAANPAPVTSSAAPWKTVWLDHISFRCTDYKRSVDFYTGLMGWEVKSDQGNQAQLDINGLGGIIIRNARRPGQGGPVPNGAPGGGPASGPPGAAPPQITTPADSAARQNMSAAPRPPVTAVIDHISWGIEPWDKDAVKAELEKRGLIPRPDFQQGGFESYHVRDPDGWDLQISNQTKTKHTVGG